MPSSRTVVLVFGRFNPPTTGHGALVNFVNQIAQRNSADVRVYPSQTQDSRKNPLPFRNKVAFLRKFFPKLFVSSNVSVRTPVDAFAEVSSLGYRRILMIVGSDRVRDFQKFAQYLVPRKSPKYNAAKHIDIDHFQVIAVPGNRDPDADDVSGMSASKMRALAKANDFKAFGAGIPSHVPQKVAKDLFNQVRRHMGLREMFNLSEGQFNIGLLEAPQTFAIVAIVNNKVVDQQWDVSKKELPYGVQNFQRDHPKATLSIENDRGRVVSVIKPGQQYKEGLAELATSTKKFGWSLRNLKPGTRVKISGFDRARARGADGGDLAKGRVVSYHPARGLAPRPNRPAASSGPYAGDAYYIVDFGAAGKDKVSADKVIVAGESYVKEGKSVSAASQRAYNKAIEKIIAKHSTVHANPNRGLVLDPGTWVKISDSPSRSGRGKVVRYDKGDRHGSPFYIIDVGKYESEKIPAHNVVKEDVEQIEEANFADQKRHAEATYRKLTAHGFGGGSGTAARQARSSIPNRSRDAVNVAVEIFLHSRHSDQDWRAAGKMLDKASDLGILWDKKVLKPINRRRLGIDEEAGEQMEEAAKRRVNASPQDQKRAASIIFKALTDKDPKKTYDAAKGLATKASDQASVVIDHAIKIFRSGRHTPKGWRIAGQMLNKATELGIRWNSSLISPATRRAMKMDESTIDEAPSARSGFAANPDQRVKVGDKVRAGLRVRGGAGFDGKVERIDGNWIYVNLGPEPGSKWGDRIIKAPRKYVMVEKDDQWVKEAATPPAVIKPPTETEKLRTTQQQELIALKTRQANTMMAAKLRDVQQKAREQQAKANQPKGAASPASS